MNVAEDIIRLVNLEMQANGKAHLVQVSSSQWVDTGSIEWAQPLESEGAGAFQLRYSQLILAYHEFMGKHQTLEAAETLAKLKQLVAPYKPTIVQGMAVLDTSDITPSNPREGVNRLWWNVKTKLRDQHVVVYRTNLAWHTADVAIASALVVATASDQFEIFHIEQTDGSNFGFTNESLIDHLRGLDRQFGIEIIGASRGVVEFLLGRIPGGKEATALGKLLLKICPGIGEAPKRFAKGRIALYWD